VSINKGSSYVLSVSPTTILPFDGDSTWRLPTAIATGDNAAAFSAFSATEEAADYMHHLDRFLPPVQVIVNGDVKTDFSPALNSPEINTADAFNWDAVEHEYGHYVEYTDHFGDDFGDVDHYFDKHIPGPGGVKQAFSEGWADFFAVMAEEWGAGLPYALNGGTGRSPFVWPDGTSYLSYVADKYGLGEDNELSVAGSLYHLDHGYLGLTISDQTLFARLKASHATTMGAAWNAIALPLGVQHATIFGDLLGKEHIAPVETSPRDGEVIKANSVPTFKWDRNGAGYDFGPYHLDKFQLVFYTSDFSTEVGAIDVSELNAAKFDSDKDTITFEPKRAIWNRTSSLGFSTLQWVVEGKNVKRATPGGEPPLDFYWSGARTIQITPDKGGYGSGGFGGGSTGGPR
jgi:hypothetical protein